MSVLRWLKTRLLSEFYDEVEALRDEIDDQKPAIREVVTDVRRRYNILYGNLRQLHNSAVSQQDEKIRAIEKGIEVEHDERVRSVRAQSEAAKKKVAEGMERACDVVVQEAAKIVEQHCYRLDKRLNDAIKGLNQQFDNLAAREAASRE